jgi:hypothetical protein
LINESKRWATLSKAEQESVLKPILNRVVIHDRTVEILLNVAELLQALMDGRGDLLANRAEGASTISLTCSFRKVSQGKAICIVLGNDRPASTESTAAIIKAVARARMWYDEIVAGEVNSIPEIAKKHGVTPSYVKRIFPCALLGPASVESILNKTTSTGLTLDHLLGSSSLTYIRTIRA